MVSRSTTAKAPPLNVPGAAVEAQLERILSSAEFRRSARMRRFLTLATREALNGNTSSLKEYRIGTEVFDKSESFDPRTDPIVRNEARRLRRKLETYYMSEGRLDPVLIELPKGAYIPAFVFRNTVAEPAHAKPLGRRWRLAGAAILLALAVAVWTMARPNWLHPRPSRATSRTPAAEAYAWGQRLLFQLTPDDNSPVGPTSRQRFGSIRN